MSELFSDGATELVETVRSTLDKLIAYMKEKQQLDNEIIKTELYFKFEMKKLSNEENQKMLADNSNTKQQEVQISISEKATKLNKNLMPYMAIGTIVTTMFFFFILIFKPKSITPESRDIVLYILGILSAILTQLYSYYFGSSAGSANKDRTIANLK